MNFELLMFSCWTICKTWGFHGSEDSYCGLQHYDTIYCGRWIQCFEGTYCLHQGNLTCSEISTSRNYSFKWVTKLYNYELIVPASTVYWSILKKVGVNNCQNFRFLVPVIISRQKWATEVSYSFSHSWCEWFPIVLYCPTLLVLSCIIET
jgi:hypothetical protein